MSQVPSRSRLQRFIEGRWYSGSPGILILLAPLEWLFRLIVSMRKRRRRMLGASDSKPFSTPVVVVGNIAVGGVGKTPIVIALVQWFGRQGLVAGVVSRGYGGDNRVISFVHADSDPARVGDEPVEIAQATGCPIVVCPDRLAAVEALVRHRRVDVVLSDDGLQHYSMPRHIEIAVLSRTQGLGNGHCLPLGPLREPVTRLRDVDYVVVAGVGPRHASLLTLQSVPSTDAGLRLCAWVNVHTGDQRELDYRFHGELVALAGIAHPSKFFSALDSLGLDYVPQARADHHRFSAEDFGSPEACYLMTAKDAVKCRGFAPANSWYLKIEAVLHPDMLASLLKQCRTLSHTV